MFLPLHNCIRQSCEFFAKILFFGKFFQQCRVAQGKKSSGIMIPSYPAVKIIFLWIFEDTFQKKDNQVLRTGYADRGTLP